VTPKPDQVAANIGDLALQLEEIAHGEMPFKAEPLIFAASLIRTLNTNRHSQAEQIEKLEGALSSVRKCASDKCATCTAIIRSALERP